MGVDASLFAIEPKRYINVWRAHNLMPSYLRRNSSKKLSGEAHDIYSNEEMQSILTENIKYYLADLGEDGYSLGSAKLNVMALEFVKSYPNSRFMFITDHSSPSDYDVAEKDNYVETSQEELVKLSEPVVKIMNIMYDSYEENGWD